MMCGLREATMTIISQKDKLDLSSENGLDRSALNKEENSDKMKSYFLILRSILTTPCESSENEI